MLNAFTVDVEEYFQVHNFEDRIRRDSWPERESRLAGALDRLLALLERHRVRGTFFILCWDDARMRPFVRAIRDAGHELASHGSSHRLVYDQDPATFRAEVERSKAYLEEVSGQPVLGYRAPSYSVTGRSLWALAELARAGFRYDSSIYPMRRRRYGIPGAPRHPHRRPEGLVEFPLTTWRCGRLNVPAASGAYLRLLPLAISVRAIRQHNAAGHPAVVNVHPWELDPAQPRVSGGYLGGLTHYWNLHRTEARLDALLGRFPFTTMRECLERAGWLGADGAGPGTMAARSTEGANGATLDAASGPA